MPDDATGMHWIFHRHGACSFALVVIDQFNVKRIHTLKKEDDTQVRAHGNRPKPPEVAFQRVKPVPRNVEGLRRARIVENRQDSLNRFRDVRSYPAAVVSLVEPFQATVLIIRYTVKCKLSFVNAALSSCS